MQISHLNACERDSRGAFVRTMANFHRRFAAIMLLRRPGKSEVTTEFGATEQRAPSTHLGASTSTRERM